MLTRRGDEDSDVDHMCVFDNVDRLKPQTFLDRLRRFAEHAYSSSEIYQSRPTLVLNLNHIRFELAAAYRAWGTYYIPAPSSSFVEWMTTDPNGFNGQLDAKNRACGFLIKPVIRLLKYWNARGGRIYDSFELEQRIVGQHYWPATQLKHYVYKAVEWLPEQFGMSQEALRRIRRAKQLVRSAVELERQGNATAAEREIAELFPPI
jgi:hypothetical protein